MFPFDTKLGDEKFTGMDIVVCGHSLGGAIASIVAIKLFISLKDLLQERPVKCITFGAPLFGDRDLQKCVVEHMTPYIHHFACNNDPVPHWLRYAQSAAQVVQDIITRLGKKSLEDTTRRQCLAMKEKITSIISKVSKVMPIIEEAANLASLVYPDSSEVKEFQKVFSVIDDVITVIKDNMVIYIPIGNVCFLYENFDEKDFFSCDGLTELEEYMQVEYQQNTSERNLNAHVLSNYKEMLLKNGNFPFGDYLIKLEKQARNH